MALPNIDMQNPNAGGNLPNLTLQNPETGEYVNIQMQIQASDEASAAKAEAWAVGERGGVPVQEGDETYHNNAKYYANEILDLTATAEGLPAGSTPTTAVSTVGDHKNIHFGIPQGARGQTGLTPNLTIGTVTDVPHGTPSSATITGTAESPVLNLNLQSGASGNETIDDTAGAGDTDKVWSADKSTKEVTDLKDAIDSKADVICKTIDTPSSIITIDDGADDLPVNQIKIGIEHVQEGTGDPSPDNVRPITGWTGCNVTRTGKNLVDIASIIAQYYSIVDGEVRCSKNFTSDGRVYLQPIQLQAGTYTFSLKWHTTSTHDNPNITTSVVNADSDTNILAANNKAFVDTGDGYGMVNRTFTLTEATQIKFSVQATNANSQALSFKDFQLEAGSEATQYVPFETIYPITFPSQAGTVYGGNLIIYADGTGELVVDRMVFEFDGSSDEVWNRYTSGGDNYYFGFQHSGTERFKNNGEEQPLSNELTAASIAISTQNIGIAIVNHRDFRIRYELNNDLDVDDLRSWLSQHPLQILAWLYGEAYYKHFYFSAPQVRTLLGLNHIWASIGDIESITYPMDATTAFDNQTTTTQGMIAGTDAPVATENHAIGDVFICNNKLYKATDAIAVGESIIEGSNVVQTSVAELMLNRPDFVFNASVMKNHPVSVTLGNLSRAIVFATGANAERVALISLLGGSTQAYAWNIHASAQITATIDGSTVTLAYSGSGSCFIDILKLSGNVTATMA